MHWHCALTSGWIVSYIQAGAGLMPHDHSHLDFLHRQIVHLTSGRLKTFKPNESSDVDLHPGADDKWGLGFLINTVAFPGGRSAGSLAWAGLSNTFYWIDPKKGICATIMMQFLPFVDKE